MNKNKKTKNIKNNKAIANSEVTYTVDPVTGTTTPTHKESNRENK